MVVWREEGLGMLYLGLIGNYMVCLMWDISSGCTTTALFTFLYLYFIHQKGLLQTQGLLLLIKQLSVPASLPTKKDEHLSTYQYLTNLIWETID